MAKSSKETLKDEIGTALYDLLTEKGHTAEEANKIVKNTLGHEENITEYALARLLVRLDFVHEHREDPLPKHWKALLDKYGQKRSDWINAIRKEVELASGLDNRTRKKRQKQGNRKPHGKPTHKKPR